MRRATGDQVSVIFQNPIWLLAALALVPLLAHLFSRARPRKRDFPSLRLLREAIRRVSRVRRPRDRWLLLLRTLAIIALILAFLQPWLMSRFSAASGVAKTVVLLVDLSASMGYVDSTRTRLAQAASAAEEILTSLPSGSKANIIWVRAHSIGILPEPGRNIDFLRQQLRQAVAVPESGDIAGAFELAFNQLGAAERAKELVVLSDFQASEWRPVTWQMPAGVELTRVAVGQEEAPNLALAGLALEPARPLAGEQAQLSCRVRNFSHEPRRATILAEAGENRLSQTVEIAPWSESLAFIPIKFPREGLVPLKASLSEDRFPGDDVRYGIAESRGALRIAIVGNADDTTAQLWTRAAQALDSVVVERRSLEEMAASAKVDVLFVAGWDGRSIETLRERLKNGTPTVIQPAAGLRLAQLELLCGSESTADALLAGQQREAPGWRLRIANEEHPVFALFASGAYGDPAEASVRERVAGADLPGSARALLAYDDGVAALSFIENVDRAPIAWWNINLGATDWPSRAEFVSFFGEFVHYLAGRGGSKKIHEAEPGDLLRFDCGAAIDPSDVTLVDERGQLVPLSPMSPQSPHEAVTASAPPPGSYRWMAQGMVLDRVVVNFPETESDLRRLSAGALEGAPGKVIAGAADARLAELRTGKPLWPWCLAAAAVFLLLEALVLWLFPERRLNKEAPQKPLAAA